MTAILKPSTDFLTSNKLLKVTYIHNYSTFEGHEQKLKKGRSSKVERF